MSGTFPRTGCGRGRVPVADAGVAGAGTGGRSCREGAGQCRLPEKKIDIILKKA